MARRTAGVISELLAKMEQTVTDYGKIKRTKATVDTIIQGTAFFPGGAGLWQGREAFGSLPEYFPENCLMFIAHNFDKEASYLKSLKRGREELHGFWDWLLSYIDAADLTPERCFFTNALMGLQPEIATGELKSTPLFRDQCRMFFKQQVAIVKPRRLAILGKVALKELSGFNTELKSEHILHPTALTYKKAETHASIIAGEGQKIRRLWQDGN